MPKQHTVTTYSFDELSPKAQDAAVDRLYDINVDYEWWESVYENAGNIGLKILSFDDYNLEAKFLKPSKDCADNIIAQHGESCETYRTAREFLDSIAKLDEDSDSYDDDFDDLRREFLHALCEDYRIILRKEYEYLTSREAIEDTIKANGYEFTADGKLWYE